MKQRDLDLRCYLVTSGTDRHTVETAAAAAKAGAGMVQVRAKDVSAAELLELTLSVADAVAEVAPTTRVVVDDRADVAFAAMRAGAHVHGAHLGQSDLPVAAARAMLGPEAVIGLTTGTRGLVEGANQVADVIDYIGCGPFRPTPTKASARVALGLEGYPDLVALSQVPLVAIGDVQPSDVADLAATGVAGVALVRSIMGADDPGDVVRQVLSGFDS